MPRIRPLLLGLALILFAAAPAAGVRIDFLPSSLEVAPNDVFSVDLVVSELGNGAPPSLGAFDVQVLFDAGGLAFQGASFGPSLGDPALFEALTAVDTASVGIVGLAEISLLAPGALDTLQTDSFVIASVDFLALSGGTRFLGFGDTVLGDGLGQALDVTAGSAAVTVVPEPAAALLFLVGSLLALGVVPRRR